MRTIWNDGFSLPAHPRLTENLYTDVAVVGGGFAGLLTAYALHRRGARVVLLERDRLASGVSAHTSAAVTALHGRCCEWLLCSFGTHLARQYMQANLDAVERFRALARELNEDCGFADVPSYLYSAPDGAPLTREFVCAQQLGAPARLVHPTELPFPVREAIVFDRQAQLSPLRFLAALARDLTVYEHSPVRDIRGRAVRCDSGTVTAEQIVVTTHFPLLDRFGLYPLRLWQERSYVLALTGAHMREGLWQSADADGLSLRRRGKYLLLGGGAHRCGAAAEDACEALREQARQLFPAAQEVCAWSSQDCMTLDGVPYIGAYGAAAPFLHVATGFGRWGMTGSMVAAALLTARLTGEDYPYADIFSPARLFPSASISAFMEGAGYAVRGLGQRLFFPAQTSARDIGRGHGGTVRWHGKKYGVYRHTDGTLFAVDIRCPHLGCELTWNDTDKSWDCPCHGSRFDYTGHRLNEPARTALRRCGDFPQEI